MLKGVGHGQLARTGTIALAVFATLIAVRVAFLYATAVPVRGLGCSESFREMGLEHRGRLLTGLTGFRGAVSLAAVLSVPLRTDAGAPFPDRDLIVVVVAVVIALTLVIQGLVLPPVARWARMETDTTVEREQHMAEIEVTECALAAIPQLASAVHADPEVAAWLEAGYRHHLLALRAGGGPGEADEMADPMVARSR